MSKILMPDQGSKNIFFFSLSHHLIVEIDERGMRVETDFPMGDPKGCLLYLTTKKLSDLKIDLLPVGLEVSCGLSDLDKAVQWGTVLDDRGQEMWSGKVEMWKRGQEILMNVGQEIWEGEKGKKR